jgi:cytochrome c biogenesis DsbD-like protein
MKLSSLIAAPLVLLCVSAALAQGSSPLVSVAPIDTVVVARGGKAPLSIALRVNKGFHVNSHQPNDELLLPTVVHLNPPDGVLIMNIAYPEGENLTLPFAEKDKMSVYSGSFEVTAEVRATKLAGAGMQRVHGDVRYQACDNRQCFPPKSTPLEFDIRVIRPKTTKKSTYTAASPHIH